MKRLFFLLAISLTVAIGTKVEAQTKLLDGVPVVLWDNTNAVDSVDADAASAGSIYSKFNGPWSVSVDATQESGTADGYVILQASNDGVNYFTTGDTITLSGSSTQGMSGTNLNYYLYRVYYDEQTAAVVTLLINIMGRRAVK